jgi:hypothetical protein
MAKRSKTGLWLGVAAAERERAHAPQRLLEWGGRYHAWERA